MRAAGLIAALLLAPAAALAEPIEDHGYTLGCDADAEVPVCHLRAAGVTFAVTEGQGTPADLFHGLSFLPPLVPVTFSGTWSNLGDSSADLVVTDLALVADDPFAETLRYIQGTWKPQGEESPFAIAIWGLDWFELENDEPVDAFMITPSDACASGVVPGGMVLSLYRLGGGPDEAACWQLEYATDTELTLRRIGGDHEQVDFTRID